MRTLKIVCLALIAAAGLPGPAADAQRPMKQAMKDRYQTKPLDWVSADGFVHFTVPAEWYRQDVALPPTDPKAVLEVSKGDPMLGQPGVWCSVTVQTLATATTQETLNSRVQEGAKNGQLKLVQPRLRSVDGVAAVDGVIDMPKSQDVQMMFSFFRNGKGYMYSTRCRRNQDGLIQPDDLKTMRIFFDTLKVSK